MESSLTLPVLPCRIFKVSTSCSSLQVSFTALCYDLGLWLTGFDHTHKNTKTVQWSFWQMPRGS